MRREPRRICACTDHHTGGARLMIGDPQCDRNTPEYLAFWLAVRKLSGSYATSQYLPGERRDPDGREARRSAVYGPYIRLSDVRPLPARD